MRRVTIFSGMPAIGKSSFRERMMKNAKNLLVLSSDDHIAFLSKQFSDGGVWGYPEREKIAFGNFGNLLTLAIKNHSGDFLIDRTHLTKGSRRSVFERFRSELPKGNRDFESRIVSFEATPETIEEVWERNAARPALTRVPRQRFVEMLYLQETPEAGEADHIVRLNHVGEIISVR